MILLCSWLYSMPATPICRVETFLELSSHLLSTTLSQPRWWGILRNNFDVIVSLICNCLKVCYHGGTLLILIFLLGKQYDDRYIVRLYSVHSTTFSEYINQGLLLSNQ